VPLLQSETKIDVHKKVTYDFFILLKSLDNHVIII